MSGLRKRSNSAPARIGEEVADQAPRGPVQGVAPPQPQPNAQPQDAPAVEEQVEAPAVPRTEQEVRDALADRGTAGQKFKEIKAWIRAGLQGAPLRRSLKLLFADSLRLAQHVFLLNIPGRIDALFRQGSKDKLYLRGLITARYGLRNMNGGFSAKALRRIYRNLEKVPASHVNSLENTSLQTMAREGIVPGGVYDGTTKTATGGYLPGFEGLGVKGANRLAPLAGMHKPLDTEQHAQVLQNNAFDHATLHEVGHSIDDKLGVMDRFGARGDFGGWKKWDGRGGMLAAMARDYGEEVGTDLYFAADAVMRGRSVKKAIKGQRDFWRANTGRGRNAPPEPDWRAMRTNDFMLAAKHAKVKGEKGNWDAGTQMISPSGRVYHEAYDGGEFVSYLHAARGQSVTWYQFRAPGEWFAELYATYFMSGGSIDRNPEMEQWFTEQIAGGNLDADALQAPGHDAADFGDA